MNNQHFSSLWLLPDQEFERYFNTVRQIADWRLHKHGNTVEPPVAEPVVSPLASAPDLPADKPVGGLLKRPPMRAAKPGSLRGAIHAVLSTAQKPLRRAEVIAAVAAARGVPITEVFRTQVGELLRNCHDPFIRHVSHGVYEFHKGGKEI